MDVASGIFAVLSLSFQLTQTIRRANGFLKDVQGAPDELTRLAETLEQLCLILNQVTILIEQQHNIGGLPGSIALIENALQRCGFVVSQLDSYVNKVQAFFNRQGKVRKVWASMKAAMKKEEIGQLQKRIHDNMANLQSAILMNMSHLQLHQMQIVTTWHPPKASPHGSYLSITAPLNTVVDSSNLTPQEQSRHLTSKETLSPTYRGIFGSIDVREKVKFLGAHRNEQKEAVSQEKSILFAPSFFRKVFELRYRKAFGQFSRTLSYFPVVPWTEEVFVWCEDGDIKRFQDALDRREVSPFVRDEEGKTLLHYTSRSFNAEFCLLLIQLGVDADQVDDLGNKAMHICNMVGPSDDVIKESVVDTIRFLTTAQDDVTKDDIFYFYGKYSGPAEGADFLLSTYAYPDGIIRGYDIGWTPLRLALRNYGLWRREWGTSIRRLLRQGADIHEMTLWPNDFAPHKVVNLTPLDELFHRVRDPFDGAIDARGWLSILNEEGFDVGAYMEKEVELHATQGFLTFEACFPWGNVPRQLIFETGDYPNVWWDWWIDPSSAASLVRKEFRHMNLYHNGFPLHYHGWKSAWKSAWPFKYPPWSKWAQSRLIRRAKRKYPELYHGNSKGSSMPGTWIDEDYDFLDF